MELPKKWPDVYPYGTKEGDEEAAFFKFIARHPKWEYRSIASIVNGTKLSQKRIEEIIEKYANKYSPPLLYPHPTNEDHWGYWERCINDLPKDDSTISQQDQNNRIGKQLNTTPDIVVNGSSNDPSVYSKVAVWDFKTELDDFIKNKNKHKHFWSNVVEKERFPSLTNPYVSKSN